MDIKINLKKKLVIKDNEIESFMDLGLFEIAPEKRKPIYPKTKKEFIKNKYDKWLSYKSNSVNVKLIFI